MAIGDGAGELMRSFGAFEGRNMPRSRYSQSALLSNVRDVIGERDDMRADSNRHVHEAADVAFIVCEAFAGEAE